MPAYFYLKHNYECPACGSVLEYASRTVLAAHPDRMSLTHPDGGKLQNGNPCPHNGKRYYAPGVELNEIPTGQ
jgi:hypothetical protein